MWDWLAAAVGIQHRAQRGDGGHLAPDRQRTTARLHYCTTALLAGRISDFLQLSVPEPAGCTASENSFFRRRSETVHQGRHYPHSRPIGGTQSTSASASRFVTLPYGLEAARFLVRHL
jgi:hypothetical protein